MILRKGTNEAFIRLTYTLGSTTYHGLRINMFSEKLPLPQNSMCQEIRSS